MKALVTLSAALLLLLLGLAVLAASGVNLARLVEAAVKLVRAGASLLGSAFAAASGGNPDLGALNRTASEVLEAVRAIEEELSKLAWLAGLLAPSTG